MRWYRGRAESAADLRQVTVGDLDAYLQERASSLRRVSRKSLAQRLRCFLRFAYSRGQTARDLAGCVVAPTLYAYEEIPSALSSQQVDDVVRACRADRSPKGLRDYAIVLLLAHYGASLETTHHYAQANLNTKREALERVQPQSTRSKTPPWRRKADLLAWLESL